MTIEIEDPRDLHIRQMKRELEAVRRRYDDMRTRGSTSDEDCDLSALGKHIVTAVADGLREWVRGKSGRSGNRDEAYKALKSADPDLAAFLTVSHVVYHCDTNEYLATVAEQLGRQIESIELAQFLEPTFQKLVREHTSKNDATVDELRSSLSAIDLHWEVWDKRRAIRAGLQCIATLIQATNSELVVLDKGPSTNPKSKHPHHTLKPVSSTLRQLRDSRLFATGTLASPTAMLVPPLDWSMDRRGGFLFPRRVHETFVKPKRLSRQQRDALESANCDDVLFALNAFQKTGFVINRRVHAVLRAMWETKKKTECAAGLPGYDPKPIPDWCPAGASKEQWSARNYEAKRAHKWNDKRASNRRKLDGALYAADELQEEVVFYFPWEVDSRGRFYPAAGTALSPQGPDYGKAMLLFARGKPIANENAARWLAIYGAGLYGYDKADLDDRADWVRRHRDEIRRVARAPLTSKAKEFWCKADEPWCFLAFCFEWAAFLDHGPGYVSRLPVAMDGTCNGIQHLAALARDVETAQLVNLFPNWAVNGREDIYTTVAVDLRETLKERANSDTFARQWLDYALEQDRIKRKLVKATVMTIPYGVTLTGCRDHIEDFLDDQEQNGSRHPFDDKQIKRAPGYLSKELWAAIQSRMPAIMAIAKWLQGCAATMTKAKLPLCWSTPTGFPVVQDSREKVPDKELTFEGFGDRITLNLEIPGDSIDGREQRQGIVPNFIHSLDAAHACMTVSDCLNNGVSEFWFVHDSFAAPAADACELAYALRRQFVRLYTDHDPLGDLASGLQAMLPPGVELAPLPDRGEYDAAAAADSAFIFS